MDAIYCQVKFMKSGMIAILTMGTSHPSAPPLLVGIDRTHDKKLKQLNARQIEEKQPADIGLSVTDGLTIDSAVQATHRFLYESEILTAHEGPSQLKEQIAWCPSA